MQCPARPLGLLDLVLQKLPIVLQRLEEKVLLCTTISSTHPAKPTLQALGFECSAFQQVTIARCETPRKPLVQVQATYNLHSNVGVSASALPFHLSSSFTRSAAAWQ